MTAIYSIESSILLFVAAALVHGTFQLGVSVLTLISGHSLGAKKSHQRLLRLNTGYILGSIMMTLLLTLCIVYVLGLALSPTSERVLWSFVGIIAALSGFLVVLSYYRKGKGTLLWLPRPFAEYLSSRAKTTRSAIEAFALGVMTVLAELPFILAPLLVACLTIVTLIPQQSVLMSILYAIVASIPLLVIACFIGAGKRLSVIQKWRESQKIFLQYSASFGLIIIASYITVFYLMGGRS